MALKHSNPNKNHVARAPYNFIPLPEKVVPAPKILPQNTYKGGCTGWIDCTLETCSPVYIRGMMTEKMFREQGKKKPDELTVEEQKMRAPFFASNNKKVEGRRSPVIPGSSLRGMIRQLVEIAGFGHVRWVASEPVITFRAVAASKFDPLKQAYQEALRNVKAGYLVRRGENWFVKPAITPGSLGVPERAAYLKIKEHVIHAGNIPGYIRLNSPNYRPQVHQVSFDLTTRPGKRGEYITKIGSRGAGYSYNGVLVCSGNMLETGKQGQPSRRRNHALILEPDKDAHPLKIGRQVIADYIAGLTPFQQASLSDWGNGPGCLPEDNELKEKSSISMEFESNDGHKEIYGPPVFYVADANEVFFFGHSPNFRVAATIPTSNKASSPLDFVPEHLCYSRTPDMVDALFGWVEEDDGHQRQCAGRVFFGDAQYSQDKDGVWMTPNPVTPHILSSPKPTTFQHYLVQDRNAGHDPDRKETLAHYATSPKETQIRGYKMYWHKGSSAKIQATAEERQHKSQLTKVIPVKAGVKFTFRIYFDNLAQVELGALLWSLLLPGAEQDGPYRHKLGMGKPLGFGAVQITPELHLTDRAARYTTLFREGDWLLADEKTNPEPFVNAFEKFILDETGEPGRKRLAEVERIQALLTMLRWHETSDSWLDKTRYMEIRHGARETNEFKDRPVLPDPLAVAGLKQLSGTEPPVPQGFQKGTVEDFGRGANATFGFILGDTGEKFFVHRNQLRRGLSSLQKGQRVMFRPGKTNQRLRQALSVDRLKD